ncbi:hypothetical protein QI045_12625 [Staphylococcus saprophyticus]|nr:hypothetical protein [Staphylococcus saprophyticus]
MFIMIRVIAVILIAIPLLLTSTDNELTIKKKYLYATIAIVGLILFIFSMFLR